MLLWIFSNLNICVFWDLCIQNEPLDQKIPMYSCNFVSTEYSFAFGELTELKCVIANFMRLDGLRQSLVLLRSNISNILSRMFLGKYNQNRFRPNWIRQWLPTSVKPLQHIVFGPEIFDFSLFCTKWFCAFFVAGFLFNSPRNVGFSLAKLATSVKWKPSSQPCAFLLRVDTVCYLASSLFEAYWKKKQ